MENGFLTGNKGEWSEVYTLFKLLADGKLYIGDENQNLIKDYYFPIVQILRNEKDGEFIYKVNKNNTIEIVNDFNNESILLDVVEFKNAAVSLLNEIKTRNKTFAIPEIEEFMHKIKCSKLKAPSTDKTDIKIVIHDQRTNDEPLLGFSIKSQLGAKSTLLNSSKLTNIYYKIEHKHFTNDEVDYINSIEDGSKIIKRVQEIYSKGAILSYYKFEGQTFKNNLTLIDSLMPNIIADMLIICYTENIRDIKKICDRLNEVNPLNYDLICNEFFYSYKIKHMLTESALGMIPSKKWSGVYDANGGYIIIKKNGDIICYHIYDKNMFENYLFNNTSLDTPKSEYGFGKIEEFDGQQFFKLNLQIRFK